METLMITITKLEEGVWNVVSDEASKKEELRAIDNIVFSNKDMLLRYISCELGFDTNKK
jgi:hypothetical protein